MAKLTSEMTVKITSNIESVKVQLGVMATRLSRLTHLMKEMQTGLVEIENDLSSLEIDVNLTDRNDDNAREQRSLGSQEEATGEKAGRVQREESQQHQEAKANKSE